MKIEVDASGLRQKLARASHVARAEPLLRAIGMRHLSWITRNFEVDGAMIGGWKPLSPNTIMGRRKGSSRPLQDSGHLKMSFDVEHPTADQVFDVSGNSVTVGTKVVYAPAHEYGVPPGAINPILPKTPRVRVGTTPEGRPIFKGGVLAFRTVNGWVFVTSVRNHPGIPKRQMLPTSTIAKELAVSVIEGVMAKIDKQEGWRGGQD